MYAYFTANPLPFEGATESGVVYIKVNQTPTINISEGSTKVERTNLVPGDTLSICGTIENGGTKDVYVLFQMKITITKYGSTTEEKVIGAFFTIVKNTETGEDEQHKIVSSTDDDGNVQFSENAFIIKSPNSDKTNTNEYIKPFEVSFTFDGATYGNEYKKATVTYYLNIVSIQKDALTASEATQLLMVYYTHQNCENASTHSYMTCPKCNKF